MSILLIFVDTNVLLHSTDMKININKAISIIIDRKFKILIHPYVEEEIIETLSKKGKLGRKAMLAMQLAGNFNSYSDDLKYEGTDIAILTAAIRENGCVLTFDKELIERCKLENISVISPYKKGRLHLIGHVD